jgi:hypothetical protein
MIAETICLIPTLRFNIRKFLPKFDRIDLETDVTENVQTHQTPSTHLADMRGSCTTPSLMSMTSFPGISRCYLLVSNIFSYCRWANRWLAYSHNEFWFARTWPINKDLLRPFDKIPIGEQQKYIVKGERRRLIYRDTVFIVINPTHRWTQGHRTQSNDPGR